MFSNRPQPPSQGGDSRRTAEGHQEEDEGAEEAPHLGEDLPTGAGVDQRI